MSMKVDFLYPFDRGFFGKTLLSSANKSAKKSPVKNVMPDSVSDFMKHFENKIHKHILERAPKADTYVSHESVILFPDMIP